jgi:hypothetical protein
LEKRFCLDAKRVEGSGRGQGVGGRNGPNNVCTYEHMTNKKKKISLFADDMILYLKDPKNST